MGLERIFSTQARFLSWLHQKYVEVDVGELKGKSGVDVIIIDNCEHEQNSQSIKLE